MPESKSSDCGVGFDEVFQRELGYVEERWRNAYAESRRELAEGGGEPTTANGLVGLAFSGGGIRSATINMGIAQALHRRGVFDHADYLSTVSGGGYLGSAISTAMRRLPDDPSAEAPGKGEFPYALDFPQPTGAGGGKTAASPFLTWIRNNSNYMATGGFFDFARMGGVLLRGILVNFLVLLPILLVLAVVLNQVYEERLVDWNALRTWNVAAVAENEARSAEAEATKTAAEGGAAALRARRTAEEGRAGAAAAWTRAAAAAAPAAAFAEARAAAAKEELGRAATKEDKEEAEQAYEAARERAESAQRRLETARDLERSTTASLVPGPVEAADEPDLGTFFTLAPLAVGVFVFLTLVFPVLITVFKVYRHGELLETGEESSVAARSKVEMAFAYGLAAIGAALVIEALPLAIHYFHELRDVGWRGTFAGIASGGALAAITAAGRVLSKLGGLRQKLVLLAIGLLGLVIPLVVMLYVTEGLIYGSWGAIQLFDPMQPFAHPDGAAPSALWLLPGILLVILGGGFGGFVVGRLWERPSKLRTVVSVLAVAGGAAGFYFLIRGWSWMLGSMSGGPLEVSPAAYVLGTAAIVVLFCLLVVDVNLTAVLGLYRDRLASAYLVGLRKNGEVFVEPDLNLEDLCGGVPPTAAEGKATRYRSKAPYHLVNTSLNLQGSSDPMLRDRNSDFLMFSKYYYGGERTGYCTTSDMEEVFPQIDLPTAMAISAAAASPNAGKMTNKPLVALMTLFNIRLGYWVPHPGRLCGWLREKRRRNQRYKPGLWQRLRWRIPPWGLLREMVSAVDEEHRWVNLSDGGHIENLAVYELLRRRCRYVICGDGEADPGLTFNGLATLMRYARIDLDIEIEILLDDLRLDADGNSHQHAALGRIVYPPRTPGGKPEIGHLLYIKSSFTANEDETMQEYRANNPAFPHESTADQFFDEGQFEAYRALGFHMADSLFPAAEPGAELKTYEDWNDFTRWFSKLRADLAPRLSAKHVALQNQLRQISSLLQHDKYHGYFYELNPKLDPDGELKAEALKKDQARLPDLMHLVGQQLDLMENAFVSLGLDQPRNWWHEGNQGWRTLFLGWAESETFQNGYLFNVHLHSGRFQNFCERTLGLPPADWEKMLETPGPAA